MKFSGGYFAFNYELPQHGWAVSPTLRGVVVLTGRRVRKMEGSDLEVASAVFWGWLLDTVAVCRQSQRSHRHRPADAATALEFAAVLSCFTTRETRAPRAAPRDISGSRRRP